SAVNLAGLITRDTRDVPRSAFCTPPDLVYTDTRPAVQPVRPCSLRPVGQLAEPRQLGDDLPDTRRLEEPRRRLGVTRVARAVVVDPHPPVGQNFDALDGVDRRALGNRGDRTAICVARMDAPTVLVGRVNDFLPARTQDVLDHFHLGVRRPENPNAIVHFSYPSSWSVGGSNQLMRRFSGSIQPGCLLAI